MNKEEIKVGDKIIVDHEYETVVDGIERAHDKDFDVLYFKEGWATRACCEKIKIFDQIFSDLDPYGEENWEEVDDRERMNLLYKKSA